MNVIYGSSLGLASENDQVGHRNSGDDFGEIQADPDSGDLFGSTLAVGDSNGDEIKRSFAAGYAAPVGSAEGVTVGHIDVDENRASTVADMSYSALILQNSWGKDVNDAEGPEPAGNHDNYLTVNWE